MVAKLTTHFEQGVWWVFDRTSLVAGPFETQAAADERTKAKCAKPESCWWDGGWCSAGCALCQALRGSHG